MTQDTRITLRLALLWLRLALGAHTLYWGIAMFVGAAAIQALPLLEPQALHPRLGVIVSAIGIATLLGLWRPVSYGLTLFLQALVTFGGYAALAEPFSAGMGRAIAELPILGATAVLFVLRDQDSLATADQGLRQLARLFDKHKAVPPPTEPVQDLPRA